MGIKFRHKGNFSKTEDFFKKTSNLNRLEKLESYGSLGVEALSAATPRDSGVTADSWFYDIEDKGDSVTISWNNRNVVDGVNIAIILQYGHGTGTGGYVAGRDYINPAIQPIFDSISDGVWKEINS